MANSCSRLKAIPVGLMQSHLAPMDGRLPLQVMTIPRRYGTCKTVNCLYNFIRETERRKRHLTMVQSTQSSSAMMASTYSRQVGTKPQKSGMPIQVNC